MSVDASTEKFEKVIAFGHPMIFTYLRVDRYTVPKGVYIYEIRHDTVDPEKPNLLGRRVPYRFMGTVLSDKPVRLMLTANGRNAYRHIEGDKDWQFTGTFTTLDAYLNRT